MPVFMTLQLTRNEAANLYNLLCDNPRSWNAKLRTDLDSVVSATDSFNARAELQGDVQR